MRIRVRSEWVTLFTVTSLALCAWFLPKNGPLASSRQDAAAVSTVDYSPVGAVRAAAARERAAHRQK